MPLCEPWVTRHSPGNIRMQQALTCSHYKKGSCRPHQAYPTLSWSRFRGEFWSRVSITSPGTRAHTYRIQSLGHIAQSLMILLVILHVIHVNVLRFKPKCFIYLCVQKWKNMMSFEVLPRYGHIIEEYLAKSCCCQHTTHYTHRCNGALPPLSVFKPTSSYIVRRHADSILPLLMKTCPAPTQGSGSRCSHSGIRTEHRPLSMDFGLGGVVLVVILQGDWWRTRDPEDDSGCEWGNQWVCGRLVTRMSLSLQVSYVRNSWWSLLGAARRGQGWLWLSCTASEHTFSIQGRAWSKLDISILVVAAPTMQTLWRADSPIPETIPRTQLSANEQPESRGHDHVLLCKRHSAGESAWAQTPASLYGAPWPPGGTQDPPSAMLSPGAAAQGWGACGQNPCITFPALIYQRPSALFWSFITAVCFSSRKWYCYLGIFFCFLKEFQQHCSYQTS